jgi:hypothetical protein
MAVPLLMTLIAESRLAGGRDLIAEPACFRQ